MKVLSLFDGISCGQVALHRAGLPPHIYFASEIEPAPIACTQRNFPATVQLGDVVRVREMAEAGLFGQGDIDLLMGGSPCQGFSQAGSGLGFDDPRSKLFFEFVRIKNAIQPKYFLLENVKMKKEWLNLISLHLGVNPVFINSADFSAQNRQRFYWTNVPILPWVPHGPNLTDIIAGDFKVHLKKEPFRAKKNQLKSGCLNGAGGNAAGNHSEMDVLIFKGHIPKLTETGRIDIHHSANVRRYTIFECEKLQTLPNGYTFGMSASSAYKALSNGWTVDVIAHILRGLKA